MLCEASEESRTTGGCSKAPSNAEKDDAVLGEGDGRGHMLGRREARRPGGGAAETQPPKDKRSRRGGVLLKWRELSEESEVSRRSAEDREGTAAVKHCAMIERAVAVLGRMRHDATTRRQSRDAGGWRGRGVARAELKPRPTSKKG